MREEDLRKVLDALGCERVRPPSGDGWMTSSCPMARWKHGSGEDRRPSFSVRANPEGSSGFKCFACGIAGRTILRVVERVNRLRDGALDKVEAVVRTAEFDAPFRGQIKKEAEISLEKDESDVWDEKEIESWKGEVPQYAINRGLTLETCKAWGLGYDRADKRLVFPVRRGDGKLVGVTGRSIESRASLRYKDYWGFRKSGYLYGEWMYDKAIQKVYVVEGLMDALLSWQRGIRNVVATMGASASKEQINKVKLYGVPVYLMQDGDAAGLAARNRMCEALRGRVPVWRVPLPPDGDPDEMDEKSLLAAVASAQFVA